MNKITKQNGTLLVPDKVVIPFIEGDGVGAEITPVCQRIVDEAVGRAYGGQRVIEWKEVLAGEKAFKQTGSWLPDETMEAFREYMIGIKGPLTTPIGGGIRSLNVALRQTLDLYVCLRPVRWFRGVVTPVKEPEKVDMYIFRENTEDIYAGIEWQQGTSEARKFLKFLTEEMGVTKVRFPETSSFGVKPVSVEGTERLVRAAIEFALANRLPSVTLVHKGNIMKFTEGGFKLWGYALAEREFPDKTFTWPQYEKIKKEKGEDAAATALLDAEAAGKVVIKDVIADAFLQNTLLVPEEYSVIATLNLNGDYVSDQLAASCRIQRSGDTESERRLCVRRTGRTGWRYRYRAGSQHQLRQRLCDLRGDTWDGTQHCRQERRESLLAFTFFRHDARIYGMERGRSADNRRTRTRFLRREGHS